MWDEEVPHNLTRVRVRHEDDRHEQEGTSDERHAHLFEAPERAGAGGRDNDAGGEQHPGNPREAQVVEAKTDANELGDDRQRIEDEQVDHAEGAPELAEAFENEAGVADAGDDT